MTKKRVIVDRKIMLGKPTIAGTRITVEQILKWLAAGETIETILKEYPYLTDEDIEVAVNFAVGVLGKKLYRHQLPV